MTTNPHSRRAFPPLAAACLLAAGLAACTKTQSPAPPSVSVAAATTAPAPVAAPTGTIAGKLCGVLRSQVPQVKGMSGIGARAQLVMAIAGAFNADAAALGTVSSEIDAIASAGCPEVSAPLLTATRTESLQEAVR